MKQFLTITLACALLLVSLTAYALVERTTKTPPPVAPPLVREGDFALELVNALHLGTAENEIEAEAMLASLGIAPENGWISDYPVTPDIIGELQDAVAAAADSKRLQLDKDEALEALEIVSADLGLLVVADTSGNYAETQTSLSRQYVNPIVINNYYQMHGPPVVTYYSPPYAYRYLYAWIAYPFWWTGCSFSGFFILRDFHKVSIIQQRVVVVTNHPFHRYHHRSLTVDPVRRPKGKSFKGMVNRVGRRGFATAEARRGARLILQRSRDRTRSWTRPHARSSGTTKSGGHIRTPRDRNTLSFHGGVGKTTHRIPQRNLKATAKNSGRSFNASRVRNRNTLSLHGGVGKTTHRIPQRNLKATAKNSGRSFKTSAGKKWRSSVRPSRASRTFSGDFRAGRRPF